jgi:hypothetical protein
LRAIIREAVATVDAMSNEQITLAHNSGMLDRRYVRAGCKCPTCTELTGRDPGLYPPTNNQENP